MNRYFQDVIDAHRLISDVLGEHDVSGDKHLQLLARFNPAFTMVAPTGAIFDHQRLVDFFEQQQGSRPGLTISLFDFVLTLKTKTMRSLPIKNDKTSQISQVTCAIPPWFSPMNRADYRGDICTKHSCLYRVRVGWNKNG